MAYILYYILLILLILTVWLNKSRLLGIYFSLFFLFDFSNWLRQQVTHYPKPYEGVGFVLFAITTCMFLAIPTMTGLMTVYSFTKKLAALPLICWASVCFGLLWMYPEIRGQRMLDAFYAYGLAANIATLLYFLSKVKHKFTFTQGTLFMGVLGSLMCNLIAIKEVTVLNLENWILIVYCNYMFFAGAIVSSWINRFAKRLLP